MLLELQSDRRRTSQLWACAAVVLILFGSIAVAICARFANPYDLELLPVADKVMVVSAFVCAFVPTAVLSVAILDLFGRFVNFSSPATRFFSKAAFGVYFLHPYVWPLISMAVIKVLESAGHTFTFYCGYTELWWPKDYTELPTWLVFLGWLCTETLSQLVLWPLIHMLRLIPGCGKLL